MNQVAVVTINYNSSKYTIECVKSILKFTSPSLKFEIIVVDNASEEEDFQNLIDGLQKINSKSVRLIPSPINIGFGAGNNLGISKSTDSEFVCFVNNDVQFIEDNLTQMKTFIEKTPDCGLCSPQSFTSKGIFIPTFDYLASPTREVYGRTFMHLSNPEKYKNRKKKYKKPLKVPFVSGSFMFMWRRDFEKIGGFDENIFLYYEESDISIRIKKLLGKDTYLVPQYRYIHHLSKSTTKNMDIKIEQKLSLLYFIEKHYGTKAKERLLNRFKIEYQFKSFFKKSYKRLAEILENGANIEEYSLKNRQKTLNR